MKGVRGGENQSKLSGWLPGVHSSLSENQGAYFILHFSCFITITGFNA
jgi:hypothetical protein